MRRGIDADIALRLMLNTPASEIEELGKFDDAEWRTLAHVLRSNVVLIRVADRCATLGPATAHLAEAVRRERDRVGSAMTTIGRIAQALETEGVAFVLTQAFQHYPDMGGDIDLLVEDGGLHADRVLSKAMGIRARDGTPASTFAAKRRYDVPGSPVPIEIHHARLGLLGEHRALARRLLARRERCTVAGLDLPIPAPEDQLLVQALQSVYAHRRIRVSDVVHIKRLADGQLDRTALDKGAREAGLGRALSDVMALAEGIAARALRPDGDRTRRLPRADASGYPLSASRAAAAFAATAIEAILVGDADRALRIAALPALGVAALVRRAQRSGA